MSTAHLSATLATQRHAVPSQNWKSDPATEADRGSVQGHLTEPCRFVLTLYSLLGLNEAFHCWLTS